MSVGETPPGGKRAGIPGTRQLRNRLALTTILAMSPFLAYGRQAHAACGVAPPFICTGSETATQTIAFDNAYVTTAPGFSVNAGSGDGITITGNGHLRFTDDNASAITGDEDGLSLHATGDAGATPGAITVTANSTIGGGSNGIRADIDGSGDLVITADGKVTGERGSGILAGMQSSGHDLTVNTGVQSDVTGYRFGIDARSSGTGALVVNANGKITATDGEGIFAFTTGRNLAITTGADSDITGNTFGIRGRNDGTGDLTIMVQGDVTGTVREGVYALAASSTANDVTVTTAAGSTVAGGYDGIEARSLGHGALTVRAYGEVTGTIGNGIWVVNYSGSSATVTTGTQSTVSGYDGIGGRNDKGDFIITANGDVTGSERAGIRAINSVGANDLTITTGAQSTVSGEQFGIYARNFARDLTITVHGEVSAEQGDGIRAQNAYVSSPVPTGYGRDLTITTGAASHVSGYGNGIYARNNGTGDLKIIANGEVTGETGYGIRARNWYNGDSLDITIGSESDITGQTGISARNGGTGDLAITVGGKVAGKSSEGIRASNIPSTTGSLKIITGAGSVITGYSDGIQANHNGRGNLEITADGVVESEKRAGIFASNTTNGDDVKITTGVASVVTGETYGIFGTSSGKDLVITVAGKVTSAGHAIRARNLNAADDLEVTVAATSVVTAQGVGITATNGGHGKVEVTALGVVTGAGEAGIHAASTINGGAFNITTGAGSQVTGGLNGIQAFHENAASLEIAIDGDVRGMTGNGIYTRNFGGDAVIGIGATGIVEGKVAGIDAGSTGGQAVIVNDGLVRNLSGASTGLAITTAGASMIDNNGVLIGTVKLGDLGDTLDNDGLWRTLGASFFGDANDSVNNRGVLVAASGIAAIENSFFDNLELFNNSGAISLVDGLEGDQFSMGMTTEYVGTGGRLVVDAFLAPGTPGKSDLFIIHGNTSGATSLVVNLTNPIGSAPNTDGIRVVLVSGNSLEQDFSIEGGVLNAGFFAWDLRRVEEGGDVVHELYTTGLGAGSYEFAAGITGAQDIWHQSTGTLLQRQADLRALLAGTQVTPVADFSEPVEPTPVARVTPGLWFKGVGAYLERDQDEANNVSTDRKQEIYGFMAGFDFGSERAGEAWMFGLFGGYVTSDLDFDQSGSEWNYEGPSVGAYATYVDHAFYADVTVKADFLDVDIDDSDIAPDADDVDTDVLNLGGLIDAGYKMPLAHGLFAEPQASLAVVHTEIDDIGDVMGGSVDFEDETSVRGRLGLRLGHELTASNQLIYSSDVTASVWQEFAGDNDVTVAAPGFPVSDISDSPSETYGDVALGFSVQSPEGWSSFLRANYQFAEDYDALAGNAGVRYAW